MRRIDGRLADGREILWFNEADDVVRETVDRRDLPSTATTSQIRYDATLDEWVAIASHRQDRTFMPPANECPLCPSRNGRLTEVPSEDYDVVVFENRFPSLATDVSGVATTSEAGGLFVTKPAHGRCEVVCFTSDHESSFGQLSPERVRLVVEAWADRTTALSALPHVEQVFPFENRGTEIGVTLTHPHGQIYAYPFVTPQTHKMLAAARRYRERSWDNLFADVLSAERTDGERVVVESAHWTAFVPSAARWPVEVHLYPIGRCPTSRPSPTPNATTSAGSISTCCTGSTGSTTSGCPTSQRGTKPPSRATVSWHISTSGCSRCAARQASSNTSPARSRGWACSSTTSFPSRPLGVFATSRSPRYEPWKTISDDN